MAEYIERETLIANVKRVYCADCNSYGEVRCRSCGTGDALDMIEDAPTVDAVPVVRCKYCKHWKSTGSKAGNSFSDMEYIGGCEFTNYCRRESYFCSYGERRNADDND